MGCLAAASVLHNRDEVAAVTLHASLPLYAALDDEGCLAVAAAADGTLLWLVSRAHANVGTAVTFLPPTTPGLPVADDMRRHIVQLLSAACDQRIVGWRGTVECSAVVAGGSGGGSGVRGAATPVAAVTAAAGSALSPLWVIAPGRSAPLPPPVAPPRGGGGGRGRGSGSGRGATPRGRGTGAGGRGGGGGPTPAEVIASSLGFGGGADDSEAGGDVPPAGRPAQFVNPPFPHALAVTATGRVAVAFGDGTWGLYDGLSGHRLAYCPDAHPTACCAVAATDDGCVVSAGLDKAVRLWHVAPSPPPAPTGEAELPGRDSADAPLPSSTAWNVTAVSQATLKRPANALAIVTTPSGDCGVQRGAVVADGGTAIKWVPCPAPTPAG